MRATLKFVLLTAIRDRFFICLFALLIGAIGLSFFSGSLALIEQKQMSSVFLGASTRYIITIGIFIFISFHIQRLYETKEIEAILTKPISKECFIFSYWLAMTIAILILWIPASAVICVVSPAGFYNCFLWSLSLLAESLIAISIAIFCSITLEKSVISSITGLGIYFISRLSFFFVEIANNKVQSIGSDISDAILTYTMKAINAILPRLDLFAQTNWLLYDDKNISVSLGYILLQTAIYCTLILSASMIDLSKKKF